MLHTNCSTRCFKRFRDSNAKEICCKHSLRASQVGGVKAAAQIMNFMKGEDEQKIFKEVAKFSKNLMTEIQEAMFVFDNLIKSDDKSLQMILRSVETEDLVWR